MTKEGEVISVQLVRATKAGKGVGFSDQGDLIFVEGVEGEDPGVLVKITAVGIETMSGVVVNHKKVERKGKVSNREIEDPYGIDDEQYEEIEG